MTFDPSGGYGHPDHVAIHHAAREAYAEEITTVLNVSAYGLQKEGAAKCHRTQIEVEPFSWLPETLKDRFLSTEHLVRAEPPFPPGHQAPEDDLFADIRV